MIHDASRSRVQSARSATMNGSATAVTSSSTPTRNTPTHSAAKSRYRALRVMGPVSVARLRGLGLPRLGGPRLVEARQPLRVEPSGAVNRGQSQLAVAAV